MELAFVGELDGSWFGRLFTVTVHAPGVWRIFRLEREICNVR